MDNLTPTDLGLQDLDKMRMGIEYKFKVQIRGYNVELRPIEVGEQMEINREVMEWSANTPPALRNAMDENFMLAKKILEKASMTDPERKVIGPIAEFLLQKMTVDEMMFMYRQYLDGVARVNPALEEMTAEQLKEIAEEVKKSPERLTDLSSWQLLNLARHLIQHG